MRFSMAGSRESCRWSHSRDKRACSETVDASSSPRNGFVLWRRDCQPHSTGAVSCGPLPCTRQSVRPDCAEVTLEGVPACFLNRQPLLVDILREEIPARYFRLSMGIQTFDADWLDRMGRRGFGTPETFQAVVEMAHARGFTIGADLLFNLPGQSLIQMKNDIARAIGIGVDHLGLYHLVMFDGLGTPWSKDPQLLASLPPNEQACDNWLALRSDSQRRILPNHPDEL